MDEYTRPRRSGGRMKPILGVAAGSFLLGAALVGYVAYRGGVTFETATSSTDARAPAAAPQRAVTAPRPSPTASQAARNAQAVERVEEQQGGIDQRLAAAEQRLTRLDLQAQAAAGNAARAEGLLIAFATRRAIERGAELGYLADQLRLRFGDALPNAVNTVISASRNSITLDQLVARLEGLGPELSDAQNEAPMERLRRELGELFVIRRETAPSPQAERRLERARLFLESGRYEAAIQEVQNLPGADRAARWVADAERYAAAQRALDLIETAAVLEPRRLRDGAGNRIEQPSPAEEENSGF